MCSVLLTPAQCQMRENEREKYHFSPIFHAEKSLSAIIISAYEMLGYLTWVSMGITKLTRRIVIYKV